jgi:hypothetical protein
MGAAARAGAVRPLGEGPPDPAGEVDATTARETGMIVPRGGGTNAGSGTAAGSGTGTGAAAGPTSTAAGLATRSPNTAEAPPGADPVAKGSRAPGVDPHPASAGACSPRPN